jgi:hypothetical protein
MRKAQGYLERLGLNGVCRLLICAVAVNLTEGNKRKYNEEKNRSQYTIVRKLVQK